MGDAVSALLLAATGTMPVAHRVWATGKHLGLDATLWRRQKALGLNFLDVPAAPMHWRAHLADVVVRRHDIGEIARGYDRPVVLLKGEGMARDLYGDPYARRSADIDLLVPPGDLTHLAAHLDGLGYRPRTAHAPPASRYNQWEWEHEETCRVVEIHWALANPRVPTPLTHEIMAHAVEMTLGEGVRVLTPSPEHQFFLVCAHHHHHSGFLKGLVDVAAWRQTHGEAWEEKCLERARALGCERLCKWPLETLDALYGPPGGPARHVVANLSAARVMGALNKRQGPRGADVLGMKTYGVSQEAAFLWRLAGTGMLDTWRARAVAGVELVVGRPADFVREPQKGASWSEWMAWGARPMRKALALGKARLWR